jgi:hypothetical protein
MRDRAVSRARVERRDDGVRRRRRARANVEAEVEASSRRARSSEASA